VLYAIPCAALAAALAVTAWAAWRCRAYRRALARLRLNTRLTEAAWARDTAALEQRLQDRADQAARERDVLARAALIVDMAYATTNRSDLPRGGTDGC
jgi:hypothetical protein